MKYKIRYWYNDELCYGGTQPFDDAKRIVDAGLAEAVVLDEHDLPQVYPIKGESHELRN